MYNDVRTDAEKCKLCPKGQYNSELGKTDCTKCKPGKYNENGGQGQEAATNNDEGDCKVCKGCTSRGVQVARSKPSRKGRHLSSRGSHILFWLCTRFVAVVLGELLHLLVADHLEAAFLSLDKIIRELQSVCLFGSRQNYWLRFDRWKRC